MGDKVGENPAALRAAVFLLPAKNRRGGGGVRTPTQQGEGWRLNSSINFEWLDRNMNFKNTSLSSTVIIFIYISTSMKYRLVKRERE